MPDWRQSIKFKCFSGARETAWRQWASKFHSLPYRANEILMPITIGHVKTSRFYEHHAWPLVNEKLRIANFDNWYTTIRPEPHSVCIRVYDMNIYAIPNDLAARVTSKPNNTKFGTHYLSKIDSLQQYRLSNFVCKRSVKVLHHNFE